MRLYVLSPSAIPERLGEHRGRMSFLIINDKEGHVVVVGRPVVCEGPMSGQHDVLLGAYAGEIGQRNAAAREWLWHHVVGAGTCDADGVVTDWSDDLRMIETPLVLREDTQSVLLNVTC